MKPEAPAMTADRPRERLLARGPAALTDAELLALLLRTGLPGQSATQLADALLQATGGLAGLLHASPRRMSGLKGLGPARVAELLAVMELAHRCTTATLESRSVLDDVAASKRLAALRLSHLPHESFAVMFLDAQHRLIVFETMFRGTLTQTAVHPREVVQRSLETRAAAVVLCHNHPSGLLEPSRADLRLTQTLGDALRLVDVRLLDHLIVAPGGALSLAEAGMI